MDEWRCKRCGQTFEEGPCPAAEREREAQEAVIEAAKAQELTYAAYVQTGVGAWKEAYRDKCADTCHAVAELLAAEGEE